MGMVIFEDDEKSRLLSLQDIHHTIIITLYCRIQFFLYHMQMLIVILLGKPTSKQNLNKHEMMSNARGYAVECDKQH